MIVCDYCGIEVSQPSRCPYCHGTFCESHLPPESHNCKHRRKIDLEEYFRVQDGSEIRKAKPSQPRRHSFKKELVLVPVIIIILSANFWIWDYKYSDGKAHGYQVGYAEGYELGLEEGNLAGYNSGLEVGFQEGYDGGNETGYEVGFSTGYYRGNTSGYALGYDLGSNETWDEAYLQGIEDGVGRGFNIRDPTYKELSQFIQDDKTDQIEYNPDNFTCIYFASAVKTNAFNKGLRCYYVNLQYNSTSGHAIIAFNTTDRGFIYIEPQLDVEVTVKEGESYSALNNFEGSVDDIIKDIVTTP